MRSHPTSAAVLAAIIWSLWSTAAPATHEPQAAPFNPTLCFAGALSYGGAPASGTIGAAGEADCLTFNGAAGDRVRLRAVATSGALVPLVELRSGSCTPASGAELTCTLERDGGHAVLVRDAAGSQTGGYALSVQRLDAPVGCSGLTVDPATRTGAISAGETECWRIAVTDGGRVRLRVVTAATALRPRLEVLRPDGTTRCAPSGSVDQTCVADVSGTHTVLVRDVGAATGGYSLSAQRLDDPVGCSAKGYGTTAVRGVMATTGETDCWRFDAVAGRRVRIRVVRTSGALDPVVEVLRPNGTTRCAASRSDEVTCELDVSGVGTILVRDAAPGTSTGDYRLGLQRLDDPVGCSSLHYGPSAVSASLTSTAETACWRFTGAGSDRVRLRVLATSGALRPSVEILGGRGFTACATASDDVTCQLGAPGGTVLIRDSIGTRTGGYAIAIQRLNDPVGCQSDPGSTGSDGWIALAGLECWRVEGEPGRLLRVRTIDTGSGLDPATQVLRPDGTTVCGRTTGDGFTCMLDESGMHTVVVRGAAAGASGGYRLATVALNDPFLDCPSLSVSPPAHEASVTGDAEIDCYTSWAPQAGSRPLRVEATSGDLVPVVEVLRAADGQTRCRRTAPDGWFDCYGDIYEYQLILVYDESGRGHGDYEIDRR